MFWEWGDQMKRQDVIKKAAALFVEKGYNGTSTREIAKECGLTPSSLYSHVTSKEEILFEITLNGGQAFIDAIQPISESSNDPIERLKEAIFIHIHLLVTNKEEAQVFLDEWKFLSDENRAIIIEKRREYEQCWLTILRDGITQKKIKPENLELTLVFIMSVVNWLYQWYNQNGPFTTKEIADNFADKILAGIASN